MIKKVKDVPQNVVTSTHTLEEAKKPVKEVVVAADAEVEFPHF
jgi:energy-coupling factor transporter ATP-binding protein EcfA2